MNTRDFAGHAICAVVATTLLTAATGARGQSMSWFSYPPGTGEDTSMDYVSPDGTCFTSTDCCYTAADYPMAYLYRPGTGYSILASVLRNGPGCCGDVSAGPVSTAGQFVLSTIYGYSNTCNCTANISSISNHGSLGSLPGGSYPNTSVYNISDDGSVVVGSSLSSSGFRAIRWTLATGLVDLGVAHDDDTASKALAVSSDGSIIVGISTNSVRVTFFRWTQATGMVPLADLPGDSTRSILCAGAESATFVGCNTVGGHSVAFRWTPTGGMQILPLVSGRPDATPMGVSADGTRITGYCAAFTSTATVGGGAFLWTPSTGTVDLQTYMHSLGVNFGTVPTSYLISAICISKDGRHIGGNGGPIFDRRLWIAHLPAISHCGSADFNCDGDVGTDADIDGFFECLAGVCPAAPCANGADFNGDGDVGTDADIDAFFRVLSGGTC